MNRSYNLVQKNNLKLALIYILMAFSVVIIVIFIIFFILGYRFDANNGQISQYSFLQFNTLPTGANVKVNGVLLKSKTPSKTSLPAGEHEIIMQKEGYLQWQKIVNAQAGTIKWLDYALLIPKELTIEYVDSYVNLHESMASADGKKIAVHEDIASSSFSIIDISSDVIKSSKITLPVSAYQDSTNKTDHLFDMYSWDGNGRYILIKHTYEKESEWIVMDTQNVSQSKNITKIFNISISEIEFYGTSGDSFYITNNGNIRKISLSDGTLSKTFASEVDSFSMHQSTGVLSYIGNDVTNSNKVIGVYHDGDDESSIIKNTTSDNTNILTTRYFNEDYIATLDGKEIEIYKGSYSTKSTDGVAGMVLLDKITVENDVDDLSFSPDGQYLMIKMNDNYVSYDLEYGNVFNSTIDGETNDYAYGWLDDSYIWSDRDGVVSIREFDGQNSHTINNSLKGQAVVLTFNKRYIYSFVKINSSYNLQRVKLTII